MFGFFIGNDMCSEQYYSAAMGVDAGSKYKVGKGSF